MGGWDCVAWFWMSAFNYHDFDTRKEYFVGTLVNLVLVFSGLCGFLFLVAAFTESEEILDSVVGIGLIVAFIVYFVPFVSARFRRINDTIFSPFWTFAMFVPGLSIVPFVMTFWVSENVDTELFEDDVDEDIAKPVFEELKLQDVDSSELGVQVLAIYVSAMMDGLVEEYIEIDEDDKAEVLEDLLERYYDVEDVNVEQFVEEIGSHFEKKDIKAVNRIRKQGLAIYEDLKIGVTDDVVATYEALIREVEEQNSATKTDGLTGWKHKFWKSNIVKVTAPKASTEVNHDEPRAVIKQETETAESVDELAVKQEADAVDSVDRDYAVADYMFPGDDYDFSQEKVLFKTSPIYKRRDEFARDYVSLKLVPEANLPLTASKVGGYGYIPKTMQYPYHADVPMDSVDRDYTVTDCRFPGDDYDFSQEKVLFKTSPIYKRRDEFARDYVSLKLVPEANLPLTASKVGGYGYIPKTMQYPNHAGVPMGLVAQLNLDELPNLDGFPETGILAFYLDQTIDYWGSYVEDSTMARPYNVLYFSNINQAAYTEIEIKQLFEGVAKRRDTEDLPIVGVSVEKEFRLTGELKTDYLYNTEILEFLDGFGIDSYGDYSAEIFGEDEKDVDDFIFELNHRYNDSKLGGYPDFWMDDPRIEKGDIQKDDRRLLFQLAADDLEGIYIGKHGAECDGPLGKHGIAHFFIKPEDLQHYNFTDVTLNVDDDVYEYY